MKAYKGFNKDMTCRGFQYEEGKEYTTDKAELCNSGFHACEHPLNCFDYYAPSESVYHEVELEEVSDERESDTKVCAKKIKIGAALDIKGLIKAAFEYTSERCTNCEIGGDMSALTGGDMSALTGGDMSALTGGNRSALTGGNRSALTGGYRSALTGGNMSALAGGNRSALTGGYMSALTGGNMSALTGGYMSALTGGNMSALTGGYMSALTGGNMSALTGGNRSALTGGYRSALAGGNMSALRGGESSKFKGGMWSVFACEIWEDGTIKGVTTAVVDGETIKPDTWYKLENGEFVEVE